MWRDVVLAILLAIRMNCALLILIVSLDTTVAGFGSVNFLGVVVGCALLLTIVRAVMRVRGWSPRKSRAIEYATPA